jgi:hypothetical protein
MEKYATNRFTELPAVDTAFGSPASSNRRAEKSPAANFQFSEKAQAQSSEQERAVARNGA